MKEWVGRSEGLNESWLMSAEEDCHEHVGILYS
jgi:hypothetical protein